MNMNLDKRARRQSFRIIVSEIVMVLSVVAMVAILALAVSGYWLNSDFSLERQGMIQVYSIPTGASVSVDDNEPWFQHTNTSKVITSGEHTITLTKEGYDSWSKTVNISEGLLYRLHYPHLFPLEREKESVFDTTTATFATVSPNRKLLLLANNTTIWSVLNLDSDTIKSTDINISKIFSPINADAEPAVDVEPVSELFNGEIISAEWDQSNEHVLLKINKDNSIEWVLLNIKKPENSVNLTRDFADEFSDIKIFDSSANNLLAIRKGNLHKIDVYARQISAILAENVSNFDFYDSEIVFATNNDIKILKNSTPELVKTTESTAKVLIGKFYETSYIFTIEGNNISVYQKDDLEEIFNATISFIPENIKIGHDSEFIVMNSGANFATLDMESMAMREWSTDSTNFGWVNNYMIYAINDGELAVYDFDGLNRRKLASNVSNRFLATITNDKWLYYFSDDQLIREWLIVR